MATAEPEVRFICPIAPSVNNLFSNKRSGRLRRAFYKAWLREAGWAVHLQKPPPVAGLVRVLIEAPVNRHRDLDNCLKATLDLIVSLGIIENDNRIDDLRILRVAPSAAADMTISIWRM